MRVKSEVFAWREHEGNVEGTTRPDPSRDDRMTRTGQQTQLTERSLGTLTQSYVNRTPGKVSENKGQGKSLRETCRNFWREFGYTSKIDIRNMMVPETKSS